MINMILCFQFDGLRKCMYETVGVQKCNVQSFMISACSVDFYDRGFQTLQGTWDEMVNGTEYSS